MGISNSKKKKLKKSKKLPKFDQKSKYELLYYLSNDVNHLDREHMHHFFKKYIFENDFSPPIKEKLLSQGDCKVLDVGCGPGTWLLDVSTTYPNAQFFGLDILKTYPQEIKPNNLEFIEANVLNGLPFPDNEFDFVHMETMILIFTVDEWKFVLSELIRVTKLGGYVELTEPHTHEAGPIYSKIIKSINESCAKRNVDMSLVTKLDTIFETNANISKVNREEKDIIVGPNGDKIGSIYQNIIVSFFAMDLAVKDLSNLLGMPEEEFKNMVENDMVEEFKHVKTVIKFYRYWVQKDLN